MEENLSCPICQELYKEPVLLSCSHSFCGLCLKSWWREKPTQECPVCKRRSSRSEPPKNLVLRNLCKAYLQQRGQKFPEVCSLHFEKLRLFCLSDQQPVCVVCRDSKAHRDHRVRPIEEEATLVREGLRRDLQCLTKNLQMAEEGKEELNPASRQVELKFYLSRICLVLDCSKCKLSFHYVDTDTRIHCFSQVFSEKLVPFFVNYSKEPLTVLPPQI